MNVDVVYQGLSLAKGANARAEAGGLFVELEAPMPVGTQIDVVTPDGTKSARVDSVIEGPGAGMLVGFGARVTVAPSPQKSAEPNAPMAEMKSAPQAQQAPTEVAEKVAGPASEKPEKDDGGDEGGASENPKQRKRTKTRKTVIGH